MFGTGANVCVNLLVFDVIGIGEREEEVVDRSDGVGRDIVLRDVARDDGLDIEGLVDRHLDGLGGGDHFGFRLLEGPVVLFGGSDEERGFGVDLFGLRCFPAGRADRSFLFLRRILFFRGRRR